MGITGTARTSRPPGPDGQALTGANESPQQPKASAFGPILRLRTLEDSSECLAARWRLVWLLGGHRKHSITSALVHLSSRLAVVEVAVSLPGSRFCR